MQFWHCNYIIGCFILKCGFLIDSDKCPNLKISEPHLFPALHAFCFLKKIALRKNRVSGTVLMIQLMRNSPTCAYIGQNPRKWKPRYAGTRCTFKYFHLSESIQKLHFNMRQPVDEMLPDVWFHDFFLFLKQHSAVPTNFFMSKLWSYKSTALKSFLAKVSHWCTASFAHTISSISHNFHLISGFAWSSTQEKKWKWKAQDIFLVSEAVWKMI